MEFSYKIPLSYKSGKYGLSELSGAAGETLDLYLDAEYNILEYETFRQYDITHEMMNELTAYYGDDGRLSGITAADRTIYVYIPDKEAAVKAVTEFAEKNALAIANEASGITEPVSRLFLEYFADGEAADIHAVIGTEDEMKRLIKEEPRFPGIEDNSGDYEGGRATGDNDYLAMLLYCCGDYSSEMFRMAAEITGKVLCENVRLNKTADFKFIMSEYD